MEWKLATRNITYEKQRYGAASLLCSGGQVIEDLVTFDSLPRLYQKTSWIDYKGPKLDYG